MELIQLYKILFIELKLAFIIILLMSFYAIYYYRKAILKETRSHKYVYLLLLLLFLIGSYIRFSNILSEEYIDYDYKEYTQTALAVNNLIDNKNYIIRDPIFSEIISPCDSHSFAVLISMINNLAWPYFGMSIGSLTSSIFGSLSIFLIFIWLLILFNNRTISLISSVVLTFSIIHIQSSISVFPYASSIFFILISFISMELYLRNNRTIFLFLTAIAIGVCAQFYYIEVILIPLLLLRIFLKKGTRIFETFKKKEFYMLTIIPLILLIPHLMVQQHPHLGTCFTSRDVDNVICKYAKNFCGMYNIENALVGSEYPLFPGGNINHFGGHFQQFLAYELFGAQRRFTEILSIGDTDHNNLEASTPYYEPANIIALILILLCFFRKLINKKWAYLVIIFFSFVIIIAPYQNINYLYTTYAHVLGWIPLVSYSMVYSIMNMKLDKRVKWVLIIIFTLILISPFFIQNFFYILSKYSFFK